MRHSPAASLLQPVLLHLIEQRGLGHAEGLAGLAEVAVVALQGVEQQVAFEGFHRFGDAWDADAVQAALLEYRQAEGEAFGDVAQFAHVARPVVGHQCGQGMPVQFRCRAIEAQRRELQEVFEQQGDVFAAFA